MASFASIQAEHKLTQEWIVTHSPLHAQPRTELQRVLQSVNKVLTACQALSRTPAGTNQQIVLQEMMGRASRAAAMLNGTLTQQSGAGPASMDTDQDGAEQLPTMVPGPFAQKLQPVPVASTPIPVAALPRNPYDHLLLGRTIRETIYGKVKMAQLKRNGEVVAVKLSKLSAMNSTTALENPREEIRVMFALSRTNAGMGHPHVLRIMDEFEDQQYHWTVLELCQGGEFFDIISKHGRLNDRTSRKYFRQACLGTQHCHAHRICHLDLSLENLLLNAQKILKICDFGMARGYPGGPYPASGRHKPGKVGYMAPEIYAGLQFDGVKADIYSLGVILFIMLTGTPPYNEPSPRDARFLMIYQQRNLAGLLQRWGFVDKVSGIAMDLMQRIMAPPEVRISLPEILAHEWMRQPDV